MLRHQARHTLAGDGAPGGHHSHMMGLAGKRGRFDSRFHANDGQLRQAFAQQFHGRSGGSIAGNHENLDVVLLQQVFRNGQAALLHKRIAACIAIGCIAAVGQIDKLLVRQLVAQCLQHAEAAHTAIKNTDGGVRSGHGARGRWRRWCGRQYAPLWVLAAPPGLWFIRDSDCPGLQASRRPGRNYHHDRLHARPGSGGS